MGSPWSTATTHRGRSCRPSALSPNPFQPKHAVRLRMPRRSASWRSGRPVEAAGTDDPGDMGAGRQTLPGMARMRAGCPPRAESMSVTLSSTTRNRPAASRHAVEIRPYVPSRPLLRRSRNRGRSSRWWVLGLPHAKKSNQSSQAAMPRCGQPMTALAFILKKNLIERILRHIGEDTTSKVSPSDYSEEAVYANLGYAIACPQCAIISVLAKYSPRHIDVSGNR